MEPDQIAPAAETGRGADATAPAQPLTSQRLPAPVPDEVVVIPPAAIRDDESDHEAREVLERLVEPVAVAVAPADDPSELRAKLARTAARKKPGSRHEERFEHPDEPASS
jgi:hypothetical protein